MTTRDDLYPVKQVIEQYYTPLVSDFLSTWCFKYQVPFIHRYLHRR